MYFSVRMDRVQWETRNGLLDPGGAVEFATSLRDDLAEAERVIIQLHADNVESFLQLWTASTNASHSWRPAVSNQFRNRARAADSSTKRDFVK